VDEKKMGSDLHTFEQKVANRIQDINSQPPGNTQPPPSGQQPQAPGLNIGPISVQPVGQGMPSNNGQPPAPAWSVGPFSVQPPGQPEGPPSGQPVGPPKFELQTQGFQFSVPLGAPPAGEGR
jgi:hypothetical protein